MLILGDEHHRARPRVELLDASRDLGGISRIPQLFKQAAEGSRISRRCRSDSERVHQAKVSSNRRRETRSFRERQNYNCEKS
jgi:hypothetical protein